jgi:hypothetical protein
MFNNMPDKGFTLVEVIVSAFIIIIGISGLFGLIIQTFSYTSANSTNLMAAYLGKEGIEIIKNIRDSNFLNRHYGLPGSWDSGLAGCQNGCEADYLSGAGGLTLYSDRFLRWDGQFWSYSAGAGTVPSAFKRKITITPIDSDSYKVLVEVAWSERGRDHTFKVQENLFNWW